MSTKRVNYFSGQFLRREDFTEQYDYLRAMRQRHNSELHTYGVVEGLEVTATGLSGEIEVENGWAIDVEGKEIILASVDPVKRIVSGSAPWYITCRFEETLSDEQPESVTGINGYRRIIESANIDYSTGTPPADTLILAEITGTLGSLIVTDTRHYSGLIVKGDLTVHGNTTIIENEQMQGNVTLGDEPTDSVTVMGYMVGNSDTATNELVLGHSDTDTVKLEGKMVTGNSSTKLEIGSSTNVDGDLTVTGTITGDIAVGIVQAADLVDDAVTSVKLSEADGSTGQDTNTGSGIKTNHIQDDAITNAKLADDSVNAAKIANGTVGTAELADDSVNTAKIDAGAVGSSELAANSVTAAAIGKSVV